MPDTPPPPAASLRTAVASLDAPFAVIDRDALDHNAAALRKRAGGLPIRVASKSLRVPAALSRVLENDGYAGILGFSLPEALFLHERGFTDIVVAYPTTHRAALRALAGDSAAAQQITLMVDSTEHLDLIESAVAAGDRPVPDAAIRVCIDVDASLRIAEGLLHDRIHIGARRSPVRRAGQALALAREIGRRKHLRLVGVMSYEGQIAGQANGAATAYGAALRRLQAASAAELGRRRGHVLEVLATEFSLEFVNGGGTGSLELSAAEGTLTELAAGSGLFAPGLFDGYRHFQHEPAAYFVLPVVRRPAPDWATAFEGGFVASGVAGHDRLPTIAWPPGLSYSGTEGPGEVQTPLTGEAAAGLRLGDHVWMRHAKSGELFEHFNEAHVVSGGEVVDTWKTYRGEGRVF